jgi:phosphopantothenate---cysteine ligase (CTP)
MRRILSVSALKKALEGVFTECNIDVIVHCMAVSDFTKRNVTTAESVAAAFCEKFEGNRSMPKEKIEDLITQCLYQDSGIDSEGKIASDIDDLIINLKKTPKIITFIREAQPEAILIGFKLLNNIERDVLINTAYSLLKRNRCDFVFANDSSKISPLNHSGYLVSNDGSYITLSGKSEIAAAIVSAATDKFRGVKAI